MPTNNTDINQKERDAWEKHNLSQLHYFRSLSLRNKLEAVEGMADVVRHFQWMRANGKFKSLADDKNQTTS